MCEGGGNCLKYLNRGWNIKERRGNKDFKGGGGQAESRGGCLKKGWVGTPLQTMIYKNLCHVQLYLCKYVFIHISVSLYV